MTVGTMFPMSIYTAKILLQTTPAHMISQLDKCLREASTLDGVLEFRNEHFWTVSFGKVVRCFSYWKSINFYKLLSFRSAHCMCE
jgi:Co/Zn/Cd efflux system component